MVCVAGSEGGVGAHAGGKCAGMCAHKRLWAYFLGEIHGVPRGLRSPVTLQR